MFTPALRQLLNDQRKAADTGEPDACEAPTQENAEEPCSEAAATEAAEDATKAVEDATKAVEDAPAGAGEKPAQAGKPNDARQEQSDEDELSLGDSDEEEDAEAHGAARKSGQKQPEEKKESTVLPSDTPQAAIAVRSLLFDESSLCHNRTAACQGVVETFTW